jgi:isopentenyl-diphosphate delta-isomerase type 1
MEMFQLCDERGSPLGSASRAECHGNPGLIHMVVHLHVFDRDGRLFLQKRANTKDTNPGLWDTSVGGHVMAGESPRSALLREAREELGIDASGARSLYGFLYRSGSFETEYAFCFSVVQEAGIRPDPGEIAEGRFFSMEEIAKRLGTGFLTPMFEDELPLLRRALRAGS